jgi:hypothetical protein
MTRPQLWKWSVGAALLGAVAVGVWLASRWLAPKPVPEPDSAAVRFVDVTDRAGIRFRHFNGATGKKLLPETMGSGVAVFDFDRDGRPDLFFVNSRPWPGESNPAGRTTQALYRNRGDGTFEDVSANYGLDVELYGMGVAAGDYDNDGWPDLFVTAVGGNRLFRNAGGKRFEDATDRAGLGGRSTWPGKPGEDFARHAEPVSFPSSAVWLDYDNDGRLDLFVCNYLTWSPAHDIGVPAVLPGGRRAYVPPQQFTGAQCELYRNADGQKFEDVSAAAGIHVSEPGDRASRPVGKALGVVVCDADRDGWPDIVVANDTVRNFFFHNRPGPNGTRRFEETGLFAGIAYADGRPRGGMGIDVGEIQPDTPAVVIANFTNEPNSLFQVLGTNPVRFGDTATQVGLAEVSRHAMKFGAVFLDCDRDGRLDLFTANGHLEPDIRSAQPAQSYAQAAQLFVNTGKPGELFVPVTGDGGLFAPVVGRGCAYLDYDGDGKLDLVVTENNGRARLFRNETADGNRHARFVLTGDDRGTNRDAIGAEVTVHADDSVQRRYVTGAHGYLSQSELAPHFGVGKAASIERITVRWPGSGKTQEWQNLPTGTTHYLIEGNADAKPHGG